MRKIIFTLLSLIFLTPDYFGQTKENEAWVSTSASFDIFKKVDFNTGFSTRFNNNISNLNSYNIENGFSYKLSEKWKTSLNHRFTNKFVTYSSRINIDFKWEDEIYKRVYLTIRPRIQKDFDLNKNRTENTIRTKFDLTYKIKKTKIYPSVFTELFYEINPLNYEFNLIRVGSSLDIKSIEDQTFSIGFFKNIGYNSEFAKNRNIFTIDYKIKI